MQRRVNRGLHAGQDTREIRDIEIFLTPAEELHVGRTAERLHVSVARRPGDQEAGTQRRRPLFECTSRAVRLTPVGEHLRQDLRPVYEGLPISMNRARSAAQGKTDVLRIGMVGNITTVDEGHGRLLLDRLGDTGGDTAGLQLLSQGQEDLDVP
ncbi:hypothetical protein ACWGH8_24375 [Nonomuraea muscovyensis]